MEALVAPMIVLVAVSYAVTRLVVLRNLVRCCKDNRDLARRVPGDGCQAVCRITGTEAFRGHDSDASSI